MRDRVPRYPGRVKLTPVSGQANVYDMIRADSPTQEGDPLSKATFLKDLTAALYGLGSDAVPDDVLAFLGKYNQHWWRRRTPSYYEAIVGEYGDKPLSWRETQGTTTEIQYSDSITFDAAGVISLVSPVTISVSYTNYTAANVIKGKYFKYKLLENEGTTSPGSGSNYSGVHLAANADATQDVDTTTSDNVSFYIVYMSAAPVTSLFTDAGQWEYLQSSNRNAYPDSGTSDSYEYEYLGIPFENAVGAPKIETGSYVGTGTYGASNPNTLTFGFKPKFVWIYAYQNPEYPYWYNVGSSVGAFPFDAIPENTFGNRYPPYGASGPNNNSSSKRTGNTLTWYNSKSANEQFNGANIYYYIAIG